ncbi:DUF6265 family protein [Tahibacter caeni]|uniref:DUF6265 family protein n=1 Tax=Tahibacter caeni TaxID=1453545 RepID=UPI0021490797|nr:DUF6265 family protein [Tahibacter caeni]
MRQLLAAVLALILPSAPAAALEPPAWLAGHWRSEQAGRVTEEVWLAPAQGLMTGMSRTHGGTRAFFEFLRIEQRGEALYYLAQPRGGAATEFRAVQADADTAAFENPAHDFPQRIVYERRADGGLAARIEGRVDGKPRVERWDYRRVRAAAD